MSRRIVSFVVTPHLIEDALGIPKGHTIIGCEWDNYTRQVKLFVEGPDLPEVKEGDACMTVSPTVHVDPMDKHLWDWNLK